MSDTKLSSNKIRRELLNSEPKSVKSKHNKNTQAYNIELLKIQADYWKRQALTLTEFL